MPTALRTLLPCLLAVVATSLHAATVCVSTSADLQSALTTAASNGEDDVIQVESGTYLLDEPLAYGSSENYSLKLEGGYGSTGQVPCELFLPDPANTIIDGNGQSPLLSLSGHSASGSITVGHFTFRHGVGANGHQPVFVGGNAGYSGDVLIENNVFTELAGRSDSGLTAVQLSVDNGSLAVRDNLFTGNTSDSGIQAVDVLINAAPIAPESPAINPNGAFNNNTVAGNTDASSAVALRGAGVWSAANNVIWGNGNTDLVVGAHVSLYHNDIGTYQGTPELVVGGTSTDPRFVDAADGEYRLRRDSPLIDQGFNTPYGGLGSYDVEGNVRVVFGIVDPGAYELQDAIFADGFE